MRYYVVDDINEDHLKLLADTLKDRGLASSMPGLFWLPIPEKLLSPIQKDHLAECGPYAAALEIVRDGLKLELLARARGRMRCECVSYAPPALRDHLMDQVNALLDELGIPS